MAQVSSYSFTTNESEGRSLTFNWSVDSTSISDNTKKIYWSLVGSGSAGGYVMAGNFKVVIDGATVYEKGQDYRIQLWNGTVVASGYKTLSHDTYGNKSFSASVDAGIYSFARNVSGSGTWELPTIPRYANFTSHYIQSKTETSITIYAKADATCDWCQYSLNGGAWQNAPTLNYTISGLTANTSYTIKTRIRRKDSQLWTESGVLSGATYDYPHCNNAPNFTIGDILTLGFYNPLSRSVTVTIVGNDGSTIDVYSNLTGTTLSGYNAQNTIDNLYKSIPNSQSGRYKVIVSYGDVTKTQDAGSTYKIRGTETPTPSEYFNYEDNNKQVTDITRNNQHIVQNQSVLFTHFSPATTNKGAGSIVKYVVSCNGKSVEVNTDGGYEIGTIDSANDVDLTLTAIDSRGLSSSKTIRVTMLAHSNPTANVTLQRVNNYEDETHLIVDGSFSSVNGKNHITITFRKKETGGDYGDFFTIADREDVPLILDKNKSYVVNVVVTDAFGSTFNKEYTIGKGVFPFFIDTKLNSVGVNKFPKYDKSFEAQGLVSLGERQVIDLGVGESIEIPIFLLLCSGLVNFRIAGANLEVARLFYVFRSNQYFGLHKSLVDESYGNTSAAVPMEMHNSYEGYVFKITNNHSSPIVIRYGILELC